MIASLRTLALAAAITATLAACSKPQPQTMPPPEVSVVTAQAQSVPLRREMVGRLSAYRSADVRARVAGVLEKRLYTEGSMVKEGQTLFQIDPAPLQAALSQAQGELASAKATYTNAKVTAERDRRLINQQYVSQSDLDSAEATERSSAASVQQAEAAVRTANINLGYASVSAPISGRAGSQQVTEGALVGSSDVTLLTTIDQIDPLYVNFSISNEELMQLRQAQRQGDVALSGDGKSTVAITLGDGSTYAHPGTLDFSAVNVDPATGTVSLRAILPNPDHLLLPGAFVSFRADLGQRSNTYQVPSRALQRDSSGPYLLVVGKDGKVVRKNVTTDSVQDGNWLITAGLSSGDQVIVDGVQKVKEGAPAKAVALKPTAAAGNPGNAGTPSTDTP